MTNIMTPKDEHERRCVHGVVMMGYEIRGIVPPRIGRFIPIWTPILYRRAVKALKENDD